MRNLTVRSWAAYLLTLLVAHAACNGKGSQALDARVDAPVNTRLGSRVDLQFIDGPAPDIARRQISIPLGVYWPISQREKVYFEQLDPPVPRWSVLEERLDDLAAHGVNTIWLTKLPVRHAPTFVAKAVARGISVIAALNEIDASNAALFAKASGSDEDIARFFSDVVDNALSDWTENPPASAANGSLPLAWGLGDEPGDAGNIPAGSSLQENLDKLAIYVDQWRSHKLEGSALALTAVFTPGNLRAAHATPKLVLDHWTSDIYNFVGTAPGFGSIRQDKLWRVVTRLTSSKHPWLMGQAFAKASTTALEPPTGSHHIDDKGIIWLCDGMTLGKVMPSPSQISWQAWAALAHGARGFFFYLYLDLRRGSPLAGDCISTNSSNALVKLVGTEPNYGFETTDQYEAVYKTFTAIQVVADELAELVPTRAAEAWVAKAQNSTDTSLANTFVNEQTGDRYLFVVAGYDHAGPVDVILGPHIKGLTRLPERVDLAVQPFSKLNKAVIDLPAGTGALFKCTVDADNLPQVVVEDFSTGAFLHANTVSTKLVACESWQGFCMSADASSTSADLAFALYDLNTLIAAPSERELTVLVYEGKNVGPEDRGVMAWDSTSTDTFNLLTQNRFRYPVIIGDRYLKIGTSYLGASNHGWGRLERVEFLAWKRAN